MTGTARPEPEARLAVPPLPFPQHFVALLKELSPLALAFSGGLDSRFLAHAAHELAGEGVRAHLFHASGPHVSAAESREARDWAKERGLPLTVLPFDPLDLAEVRAGGRERCYACKRALFEMFRGTLKTHPFAAGQSPVLCDGSNASDEKLHRPGLRALRELGVRSPLAEAGIGKEEIRRLAALSGMDRPEQRARPCLLTRLAYGLTPEKDTLAALALAEEELGALLASGAESGEPQADFRLRLTGLREDAERGSGPGAYRVELHLGAALIPGREAELAAAVERRGFARPLLVLLDRVSGHYDRETKLP